MDFTKQTVHANGRQATTDTTTTHVIQKNNYNCCVRYQDEHDRVSASRCTRRGVKERTALCTYGTTSVAFLLDMEGARERVYVVPNVFRIRSPGSKKIRITRMSDFTSKKRSYKETIKDLFTS